MDDGGREVWLLYYMSWLGRRAPQSSRQHLCYHVGIACRTAIVAWRQKSRWGSRFLSWKHIWDLCAIGGRSQLSHQLFSFLSQWISWHAYASLRFCSLQSGLLTDQYFSQCFHHCSLPLKQGPDLLLQSGRKCQSPVALVTGDKVNPGLEKLKVNLSLA